MAKKIYLKLPDNTSLSSDTLLSEEGTLNNLLSWAELVKFIELNV